MEQMFAPRGTGLRDVAPPARHRRHRSGRRRARAWASAAGASLAGLLLLSGVAYGGSSSSTQRVVVHRGDTIWSIASSHFPADDPQQRVVQIETLNHLRGGAISPGEVLSLPES